jgi:hypothetical protein
VHGTGVIGWLAASLLLAGCTLPTHHAVRATTPPPTTPTPTVASAAAVASPSPTPSFDLRPQPVGYVALSTFLHGPTVPIVVQRKKYVLLPGNRQLRLDVAAPNAPCSTTLSASPSGHWLAFTTPQGDLRVVDLRGGNQYSLGTGCDPTWGADGRLAYLVAGPVDTSGGWASAIVVRLSPLTAGTVWAKGRLQPQGWAGDRLVYTSADKAGDVTPVVSSRPGGGHYAPAAPSPQHGRFIAASQDGRRMLLQLDNLDHQGRPAAAIDLVDTRTLRVLSTVQPKGFEGLRAAAWTGDRIVASNGVEPGDSSHPPAGLIRLSTYRDRLTVQQVAVPTRPTEDVSDYIADLHDNGNGTVSGVHHRHDGSILLRCRITTLRCTDVLRLGKP